MSDSDSMEELRKKKVKRGKTGEKDKRKEEKPKKQKLEDPDTSDEEIIDRTPVKKAKASSSFEKNADGDEMMPLGKMRYVTVRSFKGRVMVDLREFYQDNTGATKPGKKGLSLSKEQYEELKKLIPEIDKRVEEK